MDAAATTFTHPAPPDEATTQTEQRRDAIKSVIGQLAEDVLREVKALRELIDDLEKLVLSNAARVSENLNEHVAICGSVRVEVARVSSIVHDLRQSQLATAADLNRQELQ
jgi:hypothetical protein